MVLLAGLMLAGCALFATSSASVSASTLAAGDPCDTLVSHGSSSPGLVQYCALRAVLRQLGAMGPRYSTGSHLYDYGVVGPRAQRKDASTGDDPEDPWSPVRYGRRRR